MGGPGCPQGEPTATREPTATQEPTARPCCWTGWPPTGLPGTSPEPCWPGCWSPRTWTRRGSCSTATPTGGSLPWPGSCWRRAGSRAGWCPRPADWPPGGPPTRPPRPRRPRPRPWSGSGASCAPPRPSWRRQSSRPPTRPGSCATPRRPSAASTTGPPSPARSSAAWSRRRPPPPSACTSSTPAANGPPPAWPPPPPTWPPSRATRRPPSRPPVAAALDQAEQAATAARVAGAAVGERRRLLDQRRAELRAQAAAEVEASERRARARAARLDGARRAGLAATAGASALARLERSLAAATTERDRLVAALQAAREGLTSAAAGRRQAAAALDEHHAVTRASDEARVEARLRAEELGKRIVEEFAIDPDEAMAEYLLSDARLAELPETDPRRQPSSELRRVAAALDRRLTLLGRVNPLALEEFKALEERYTFLSGQLQDLKESRRDLLKVVRAVDERVREVFGQAFQDVAAEFQRTFGLLFPGGEGRLVLTEPDDLLATGVEVEARPPGKKVRRLSLLSGGERSLVALAFYFAIFRARPSPFYVLDEVEAALDDVNLHRFLDLLDDAREHAQLLVVSHQRRTMEAADALYGVSMQTHGVSKVVSRRLRSGTLDGNAVVAATR